MDDPADDETWLEGGLNVDGSVTKGENIGVIELKSLEMQCAPGSFHS